MAKCYFCGKGPQFGHNVSYSKRHTKRRWRPNLHPMKINVDGKIKRVMVCMDCFSTQHKAAR